MTEKDISKQNNVIHATVDENVSAIQHASDQLGKAENTASI
jgi:hypothetical protein